MAESGIVSFRATQAAQEMIDRIVAAGIATTRSDAINLALESAPEGLSAKIARDAEALKSKSALLAGTGNTHEFGPDTRVSPAAILLATSPSREVARDSLIETFLRVIKPARTRPFGSLGLGLMGVSDDNQGVQWNCWVEFEGMSALLGSNLEGIRYANWPVADYILRELRDPELFSVIAKIASRKEVEMVWWIDAWQAAGRLPRFEGQTIATERLDSLTRGRYREILRAALECLDSTKQYRGRATKTIKLRDGRRVERSVSPHFQFRSTLWSGVPLIEQRDVLMASARDLLMPIHEFMIRRTN